MVKGREQLIEAIGTGVNNETMSELSCSGRKEGHVAMRTPLISFMTESIEENQHAILSLISSLAFYCCI